MLNQAAITTVDNIIGRYFESNPLWYKDWLADSASTALDPFLPQIPPDPNVFTAGQVSVPLSLVSLTDYTRLFSIL